jgi:putative two-component system response regulator
MPVMDGFETLKRLKQNPLYAQIPVIFITTEDQEERGLAEGAVDFVYKPFNREIVKLRVHTQMELSGYRCHLEHLVVEKTEEIVRMNGVFVETMADLIEYRSAESGQHVKRTKHLCGMLFHSMENDTVYHHLFDGEDMQEMINAIPLHDVGKVAIPDSILLKPGRLTPEEFEVIKTHTTIGGEIINALRKNGFSNRLTSYCYDFCMYHHEHWDGSGYPVGLKGEKIPLFARIVALVDVYEALVSDRAYKKAMPHCQAKEIILSGSGTHFDPAIVGFFLKIEADFERYCNDKTKDTGNESVS